MIPHRILHAFNNIESAREAFQQCCEDVQDIEFNVARHEITDTKLGDKAYFRVLAEETHKLQHGGAQYTHVHIHEDIPTGCALFLFSRCRAPRGPLESFPLEEGISMCANGEIYLDGKLSFVTPDILLSKDADVVGYVRQLIDSYWANKDKF